MAMSPSAKELKVDRDGERVIGRDERRRRKGRRQGR